MSIENGTDLSPKQKELRTGIITYLKNEGFRPELDDDGDILFKYQGEKFYIVVDRQLENPMMVNLISSYSLPQEYSKLIVKVAANDINMYKGVKMVVTPESFQLRAEYFVQEPMAFVTAIEKTVLIISAAERELLACFEKAKEQVLK